MTNKQRKDAVQIAEDVLAQLKTRKYVASAGAGVYVRLEGAIKNPEAYYGDYVPVVASLRTFLTKHATKKSCHVCALGACFLANVERRNKVELKEVINKSDRETFTSNLKTIFSAEQMDLIEVAFEVDSVHSRTDVDTQDALYFGNRYDTDDQRLKAIMRNIIKNNGEFIPPARKDVAA